MGHGSHTDGAKFHDTTSREKRSGGPPQGQQGGSSAGSVTDRPCEALRLVRYILALRRARTEHFQIDFFGDPAWDIMLVLYLAHCERYDLTVSSVCAEVGAPATTTMRWIGTLERSGLVVRRRSERDQRVSLVGLTGRALAQLEATLESVSFEDMVR